VQTKAVLALVLFASAALAACIPFEGSGFVGTQPGCYTKSYDSPGVLHVWTTGSTPVAVSCFAGESGTDLTHAIPSGECTFTIEGAGFYQVNTFFSSASPSDYGAGCSNGEEFCVGARHYKCFPGGVMLEDGSCDACSIPCTAGELRCFGGSSYRCEGAPCLSWKKLSGSCGGAEEGGAVDALRDETDVLDEFVIDGIKGTKFAEVMGNATPLYAKPLGLLQWGWGVTTPRMPPNPRESNGYAIGCDARPDKWYNDYLTGKIDATQFRAYVAQQERFERVLGNEQLKWQLRGAMPLVGPFLQLSTPRPGCNRYGDFSPDYDMAKAFLAGDEVELEFAARAKNGGFERFIYEAGKVPLLDMFTSNPAKTGIDLRLNGLNWRTGGRLVVTFAEPILTVATVGELGALAKAGRFGAMGLGVSLSFTKLQAASCVAMTVGDAMQLAGEGSLEEGFQKHGIAVGADLLCAGVSMKAAKAVTKLSKEVQFLGYSADEAAAMTLRDAQIISSLGGKGLSRSAIEQVMGDFGEKAVNVVDGAAKQGLTPSQISTIARKGDLTKTITAATTKGGKNVWLETGDAADGWMHIEAGHFTDFINKFGPSTTKQEVIDMIMDTVRTGTSVASKNARGGTVYIKQFSGNTVEVAVSENGYILTAHPG